MLLKLLFRNAFRHRLRAFLTLCGMAVAILAFGLLRTVVGAWYAGVEASSASRLVTRNAISLVFPLPLSYRDKIRSVEGITRVSYGNWFGGIYIDQKNFFANFAVEPGTYLEVYSEYILPEDQKTAFLRDRKSCIAGRKLARRFNWRIGDSITLKGTAFPGDWDFVLKGIYTGRDRNTDESQFFFHWEYLNETLRKAFPRRADQVGVYIVSVAERDLAPQVSEAVDALFKNSYAETLTETERAFQMGFVSMTEAILMAIQLVSLVIVVIILAVVANTMVMSVRERMGEYAVFKTLGFGGWHIGKMILGESLLLALSGGGLGMILIFPLARKFSQVLGAFFPVFQVAPATLVQCLIASLAVAVIAAIVPTWRAVSVSIAEGLRRIG
jgi:putative ABC transport system permease protein